MKSWIKINENLNKRLISIKGKFISDDKQIANVFNNFFTNIAPTLANKLGPSKADYRSFLKNQMSDSFFISPVEPNEVKDEIMMLKDSKSPDSYEIPIKISKIHFWFSIKCSSWVNKWIF